MVNEFSRTELLMGEDALKRIKHAVVMVFGVGGVGSHCIEALARCGVGKLILVDNDTVSLTNINRQSIAYHSTIGQYKTKVMEKESQIFLLRFRWRRMNCLFCRRIWKCCFRRRNRIILWMP